MPAFHCSGLVTSSRLAVGPRSEHCACPAITVHRAAAAGGRAGRGRRARAGAPARFLDLAPTTPSANSSMPTAQRPHQRGMLMDSRRRAARAPPAPAPPLRRALSTSSQVTPPAAVVSR